MAYDVASLITGVKTRSKDTSLPDDLIMTFLQEAQDTALGHYRLSFLETSVNPQPTLSINDLSYSYPTGLQTILALKLHDGENFIVPDVLSYQEFEKLYPNPEDATAGPPLAAADYGRTLYWNQPLDKAYTLELKYLRRPTQFTSTADVPDIPIEYRELLVRGALARVEEYHENYDIAALHYRAAEEKAEDMLLRYSMRQLVTPHRATTNGRQVGMVRHTKVSRSGF